MAVSNTLQIVPIVACRPSRNHIVMLKVDRGVSKKQVFCRPPPPDLYFREDLFAELARSIAVLWGEAWARPVSMN